MHSSDQTITLSGSVERVLFFSQETGFIIFVVNLNDKQEVTMKGYIPVLNAGEQVRVQGTWIMHPKFGKQFEAKTCLIEQPTSITGLLKYLGSGLIKGIGPLYAQRLVDYFGQQVLVVIDTMPERLLEVAGIGEKRKETIITAWKDQKEISHIMIFLQEKGISTSYATKIYKKYKDKSIEIILENPYRLCEDIWGIGFKTADTIAQQMNITPTSTKRCRAGILHVMTTIVQNGHLYTELKQLKHATHELLTLDTTVHNGIKHALHDLYNEDKIKLVVHEQQYYITLSQYYYSEKGVASFITQLQKTVSRNSFHIQELYTKLRTNESSIHLNDDQQRAIMSCLQNKITIITGGPGTGKTTTIKQLLTLLDQHKTVYKLAAPTGRAAKRITQSTGKVAVTLHRLLEFDPSIMNFTRNEDNALVCDMLIVDESSMIDIFLAHALLKAVPHTTHLVFLGDSDQLPSVGAGNFLHDMIASQKIPTIRLSHIFRQSQNSLIILNAHRVNTGQFPSVHDDTAKKDFFFIKEEDPLTLPAHLQRIYKKILPQFCIPHEASSVLVPMNRGPAGTHKLNHDMQALLNPIMDKKQISRGIYTYTIGDRVMQIRNNYEKLIFNGDNGIIQEIDLEEQILLIQFDNRLLSYDFSELDELMLAYVLSIHKSQGSEYDAVIIPLFMSHFTLLQRNLLYTAITRAKKLCILIGQSKAIHIAINNNKGNERITFLKEYLTSNLSFYSKK